MTSERPVCFNSNGHRLYGIVHEPSNASRSIGLIFLNGWGGYRIGPHRLYVKGSRAFSAQGFHVLRFDFRGTGDSEGELANISAEDTKAFIDDCHSAIDFLCRQYKLNRWYLLGLCTGGEVATLYASGTGIVHGLILWSTASHFEAFRPEEPTRRLNHYFRVYLRKLTMRSTWQRILRGRIHFPGIIRTLFSDFGTSRRTDKTKPASFGYSDLFTSIKGSVLLTYGTADPHAKSSYSFFEKCLQERGLSYSLHLIDGADASFSSLEFEKEVIAITQDWLVAQTAVNRAIPFE